MPEKKNIQHKSFGESRVNIEKLLLYLKENGIQSVFIEGGSEIHGSFYDSFIQNNHIIDDVLLYISPIIIGGKQSLGVIGGKGINKLSNTPRLKNLKTENIKDDIKITGFYNLY